MQVGRGCCLLLPWRRDDGTTSYSCRKSRQARKEGGEGEVRGRRGGRGEGEGRGRGGRGGRVEGLLAGALGRGLALSSRSRPQTGETAYRLHPVPERERSQTRVNDASWAVV